MDKSTLKAVSILLAAVLIGGGYYFLYNQLDPGLYRDDTNNISFEKPEGWAASSIAGYAKIAENTLDPTKPSVLIKIEYPESIIPSLGLDVAEEGVVGGKTVRRADHEWETKTPEGKITGTQTFTFLMWEAPDGRKIIFEISPWQKPGISPEVEKVIRSFNTL